MVGAVSVAPLLLFLVLLSSAHGLLPSKAKEIDRRPAVRSAAGYQRISLEINAASKALNITKVLASQLLRPKAAASILEVEQAVFDALAASRTAATRATAAADAAVRAQRAASTLVTISAFTALCIIVLHLPRVLAILWGGDTKLDVLSVDPEAQLDQEKLGKKVKWNKKAIKDKAIDGETIEGKQHEVKVSPRLIQHHAALAALKLGNSRTEERPASPADVASLARSSQFAAAWRLLQKLNAAGVDVQTLSGLTSGEFERLRRIGSVYEASLPQLHNQVSTYKTSEKNAGLQLEWGIKLENGMMKVMSTQDMPNVDIIKCVAAHVEKEIIPLYDKDTISCESCGERFENDGIWRSIMHTRSTGSKSDLVNYSSLVDALDEPLGSIWVAYYVSAEFTPSCAGIPPTMAGHFRTPKSLYVVRFEPLNAKTRTGVRMTSFLETGVSTPVYSLLTLMPGFALRRLVRGMVETAAESLDNFCQTNPKLDEIMKTSPSAQLYQRLQSRIEEKKK